MPCSHVTDDFRRALDLRDDQHDRCLHVPWPCPSNRNSLATRPRPWSALPGAPSPAPAVDHERSALVGAIVSVDLEGKTIHCAVAGNLDADLLGYLVDLGFVLVHVQNRCAHIHVDRTYETKASASDCLDDLLRRPIVAQNFAGVFMTVAITATETTRPSQTWSIISSLVTTRSRWVTNSDSSAKAPGSIATSLWAH